MNEVKPIVLMTLGIKESGAKEKSSHEQAADRVLDLWQEDLGADKVYPLISRITSAVVAVQPDPVKKELCP